MRKMSDVKILENNYGSMEFEIIPPGMYSYLFSNKMLDIEIKDRIGYTQVDLSIPDNKAYELYCAIDSIYQDMNDTATTASVLRTVELPPVKFWRYSAILSRQANGIISMNILEVHMYDGNSRSIYTEFDTASIEFQEFMAWMYCNFESCALKYGFTGKYYYDHIREIM